MDGPLFEKTWYNTIPQKAEKENEDARKNGKRGEKKGKSKKFLPFDLTFPKSRV
jgi:hypothetical protein